MTVLIITDELSTDAILTRMAKAILTQVSIESAERMTFEELDRLREVKAELKDMERALGMPPPWKSLNEVMNWWAAHN